MISFVGLVCLMAVSVYADGTTYQVMDSQIPLVEGGQCHRNCVPLMSAGLEGINQMFKSKDLLKDFKFSAGYCDLTITNLGGFTFTEECFTNADKSINDHKLSIKLDKPTGDIQCSLPTSPKAAAAALNKAYTPVGKCGKDGTVGNKLPKGTLSCDEGKEGGEDANVGLTADLEGMVLDVEFRVEGNMTYPLRFSFTLQKANPVTKITNNAFDQSWACLSNEANLPTLLNNMFIHAAKQLFKCTDEKHEHEFNFIEPVLYMAGRCFQ